MDESQLLALNPELDRFLDRFAPLFGRDENQAHARRFVQGLLHGGERRNAENIAQAMSGGPSGRSRPSSPPGPGPTRRSSRRCPAPCSRRWAMTTRSGTPTRPASPRRGPSPSASNASIRDPGPDRQLPGRRLRQLLLGEGPHLHGPPAVPARGMGRRL